jgi:hypothetical protein
MYQAMKGVPCGRSCGRSCSRFRANAQSVWVSFEAGMSNVVSSQCFSRISTEVELLVCGSCRGSFTELKRSLVKNKQNFNSRSWRPFMREVRKTAISRVPVASVCYGTQATKQGLLLRDIRFLSGICRSSTGWSGCWKSVYYVGLLRTCHVYVFCMMDSTMHVLWYSLLAFLGSQTCLNTLTHH